MFLLLDFALFQSTPSVWRETILYSHVGYITLYFNPLPPYGGRRHATEEIASVYGISIHSLRMEGDPIQSSVFCICFIFQSTPSVWRETLMMPGIHGNLTHFNPLPPYGGRPAGFYAMCCCTLFQSTPSVWRETQAVQW